MFGGLNGMLRMDMIVFDSQGRVKLQDFSHVYLGRTEIDLYGKDKVYLPPEAFYEESDKVKADVWTLGIILLFCMSLDSSQVDFNHFEDNFDIQDLKTLFTSTRQKTLFLLADFSKFLESRSIGSTHED